MQKQFENRELPIAVILRKVLSTFIMAMISFLAFGETVAVFFDSTIEQHKFAAYDIKAAIESRGSIVEFTELSTLKNDYEGKKIVIALANNKSVDGFLKKEGGSGALNMGEQAYALRTTSNPEKSYWVIGGDVNGAMYGALQIAEYISFNGISGTYNEDDSPYLKNRGIKFNIPLDLESPTYYNSNIGTAFKMATHHVWDMDFWKTWFDEMARNRYNVLSLWSPHPFTAMLNMEDEYPGIAIQGVMGSDRNGNMIRVNDWTIDEKIAFWQQVMQYGKERGFDIYFCTWNIFLSTAEDKHGLTQLPANELSREYIRKCTKKFFETYPDLKGLGITVGERMHDITNTEKEEWAWDSYGKGILEYAQENPDRDLVFIHRQHQGDLSDILEYFEPLIELPNVRFDLSFKYSKARMHATSTPGYWDEAKMEQGLDRYNLKSWLTLRNDDWYFLHWADPQFAREYVSNFPEVDKYVNAAYIGSDGWAFTKVFTSRDNYYQKRDMLSIQRTWFLEKLWGRALYNPSVSDDLFKNHLALKYPEVSSEELYQAWTSASRALQLSNEQVSGTWKLDWQFWPEGWTAKHGEFLSLGDTRKVVPMLGSNLCSFENTARGNCEGKVSAFTTVDRIEKLAGETLNILKTLHAGSNKELELTLKNLEAMAYLGLYNAHKFRTVIYLEQENKKQALIEFEPAYGFWKNYTNIMDELFIGVQMQRNLDFQNWHSQDKDALHDYLDLEYSVKSEFD